MMSRNLGGLSRVRERSRALGLPKGGNSRRERHRDSKSSCLIKRLRDILNGSVAFRAWCHLTAFYRIFSNFSTLVCPNCAPDYTASRHFITESRSILQVPNCLYSVLTAFYKVLTALYSVLTAPRRRITPWSCSGCGARWRNGGHVTSKRRAGRPEEWCAWVVCAVSWDKGPGSTNRSSLEPVGREEPGP